MSSANLPGALTVYRRRAMASDFEVSLNEGANGTAVTAALAALDEVDRFESLLSVFRSDSAVSRMNLLAAEMNVRVDQELIDILALCRTLWEETEGAFDITSAPLWTLWGFARRQGSIPTDDEIAKSLEFVGMQHVSLRTENCSVAFDHAGVQINFGGIGKGLALDAATQIMDRSSTGDFLVHGGKSSVVARGGRRGDTFSDGSSQLPCWTIGLAFPKHPDRRLAELHLHDTALATSGSQYQFFRYKGERLSHILNPKTGQPAKGILSTTVITSSAAVADALSTAFFVMGLESIEAYCERHPEIGAIIVTETKKSPGYETYTYNVDSNIVRFL